MPSAVGWNLQMVKVEGDITDVDGQTLKTEELELWCRDPVECVRELMSNPLFRDMLAYAPERAYADSAGEIPIYDDMWTGEWWWELQVRAFI